MNFWTYINNWWRPALEIFILAVAIYYLTRFLRGTRGWPVVIGFVVVMLVVFGLTRVLNLGVLQTLLAAAYQVVAVAVVIIFQPELRRLLAELGNLPLFATAHEQRENIEVIIQTVERLSDVRIGALIAIEQSIHLHDAVESGVSVDCEATPEMLETIFFPNNAIHDGGVIIKGDRIAYAACIFPLTQRPGLAKTLGTRHRAAIGLSEETDAVIVVVSEENGMISHAYKGQLVRGVTAEELRSFLTSVLLPPERPHGTMEWIRRQLGKKKDFRPAPAVVTKHPARPSYEKSKGTS